MFISVVFKPSFKRSLCILDTSPLSNMWFADIFFQLITYLFILFIGCFTEQFFSLFLMKFFFNFLINFSSYGFVLVSHFIFIPVFFLELCVFAAKRKTLSKALLWVICVSILAAIYACWVDLDYLLYSSWAVQVMTGFWRVQTTFIKTFSSLFSQLIFFLRLFSSPGFGDCTSWSVL